MTPWILGFFILGTALIFLEILVPGGILGFAGGLAMVGGCALAFSEFGVDGGLLAVLAAAALLSITLYFEFKLLPRTKLGGRMFLRSEVSGVSSSTADRLALVGKIGQAVTTLAPTGVIVLDGKNFEAFSRDGLVNPGAQLEVVAVDNFRLVVKKI